MDSLIVFWKDNLSSENINSYTSPVELSKILYHLSQKDPYTQNQLNYTKFCEKLFQQYDRSLNDIFCALLLLKDKKTDEIIGFLTAQVIYDIVEIDFIFIKKEFRHQGLALQLFTEFEKKLKQLQNHYTIHLEVSEKNLPAIEFYKKLNFKTIQKREKYYPNNENAMIMAKTL